MIQIPLAFKKKAWLSWAIICSILSITSGSFTLLIIEELGSACLHQTTLLEHLGLPMPEVEKYCTNTEKHSYLTNSIIEIIGTGGFSFMMLSGYNQGKLGWKTGTPFIKRQKNGDVA